MQTELFCCDGCGRVSDTTNPETWQEFKIGRYSFSILVHHMCQDCTGGKIPHNPSNFIRVVSQLRAHHEGKDEPLVDRYTLLICGTEDGGCGRFRVTHNDEPIGSSYGARPYIDTHEFFQTFALCPDCLERNQRAGKGKHKKHKHGKQRQQEPVHK